MCVHVYIGNRDYSSRSSLTSVLKILINTETIVSDRWIRCNVISLRSTVRECLLFSRAHPNNIPFDALNESNVRSIHTWPLIFQKAGLSRNERSPTRGRSVVRKWTPKVKIKILFQLLIFFFKCEYARYATVRGTNLHHVSNNRNIVPIKCTKRNALSGKKCEIF